MPRDRREKKSPPKIPPAVSAPLAPSRVATPSALPRVRTQFVAAALIAAFLAECFLESRIKSPVFDEPPHIAAGMSYLKTHLIRANPEHPPLLKELAAVSMMAAGIGWPSSHLAQTMLEGGADLEWPVGSDIISKNGPDRAMFWGRLPFILLAGVLGAALYFWGREIVGEWAALGALLLYVLDPTIVAHAFVIGTDSGLAAFAFLFLIALWRYLRAPGKPSLILTGAALGAALATKFSAVLLLPVAAALMGAAWFTGRKRPLGSYVLAFLGMCGIAFVVIQVFYFFPANPFQYISNLSEVKGTRADFLTYFAGHLTDHFAGYFIATYLLKEPVASIFLVALGLWLLICERDMPVLDKLFLVLPPAAILVVYSFKAAPIGVRYLIPAFPFLYLIGGIALARLIANPRRWGRVTAVILCAWLFVAAIGIYPDHLAYFNESACLLHDPGKIGLDGGSKCGSYWLDDSNVDWGQGLRQLQWWLAKHPDVSQPQMAYLGTFPPSWYGLPVQVLGPSQLQNWDRRSVVIVSAALAARLPALAETGSPLGVAWLRDAVPADVVGHSLFVYPP